MKTLLSLSILLFAAAFQFAQAEVLEFAGDPAVLVSETGAAGSPVLNRSVQLMVSRIIPSEPFRGVHVESVGAAVRDQLDIGGGPGYAPVNGYIEKCEMPDASLLPDFTTRLTTFFASLQLDEARQAWYLQNELIASQKRQTERCSLQLNSDGECWLRIEQHGDDDYVLSLNSHLCPTLTRLTQAKMQLSLHKIGAGKFKIQELTLSQK